MPFSIMLIIAIHPSNAMVVDGPKCLKGQVLNGKASHALMGV